MHPLPPSVHLRAAWPASRQLVVDCAGVGTCLGAMAAIAADLATGGGYARWGVAGLAAGAVLGLALGSVAGPRRHHLVVDAEGVRIGRLLTTVHIPWQEVAAFGRREDWHGRSGRVVGLAVCRRGAVLPIAVPALTYTASPWRVGRGHPLDRLAPHREAVLEPIRCWAEAKAVPVVSDDLDLWWDQAWSAAPRCQRR